MERVSRKRARNGNGIGPLSQKKIIQPAGKKKDKEKEEKYV